MKNYLNNIVLCICFLMSVSMIAQVKKTKKLSAQEQAKVIRQLSTMQVMKVMKLAPRKMMPHRKNNIWVMGTSTINGHWAKPGANEVKTYNEKTTSQTYTDTVLNYSFKSYNESALKSKTTRRRNGILASHYKIPKKTFSINNINESERRWMLDDNVQAEGLTGMAGKTNVYYFKKIGSKSLIAFATNYNHVIVTDTLYAPAGILSVERTKRNYIKIIANCIVYDSPLLPSSVTTNKTDFVFSAKSIIFKSKYEDLSTVELTPAPPFAYEDINIKIHKDPYSKNEITLMNRLFIIVMEQIIDKLNSNIDDWEKDKLLTEFQTYRKNKINQEHKILWNDKESQKRFKELCAEFDNLADHGFRSKRTIDGIDILVEGNIGDLPEKPFKYYAIPTKATLLPVKDPVTGEQNKLGNLYYKATGDSKMTITIETRLGYDAIKFAMAKQALKKKGMILENNPPKTVMSISEQPLKAEGSTIGSILPISNQILRFEIDLPDENLSLLELFLQTNNTFDLYYKENQGQNEAGQKITIEIPEEISKQLDLTDLLNEFSIIEINALTVTDAILITSNLWPVLEDTGEGTLDYIEISLEFLFDDKTVFYQPERFSSYSVNGSKKVLEFVKYSDNYTIKVTGIAYYEFGERTIIKDNIFTNNNENIILQESMFNTNSLKN